MLVLGSARQIGVYKQELIAIVKLWAEEAVEWELHRFLDNNDNDDDNDYQGAWNTYERLDLLADFIGREEVDRVFDDIWAPWAAKNPTLWRIFKNGTEGDRDLVKTVVSVAADGVRGYYTTIEGLSEFTYINVEELVKAELNRRQGSPATGGNAHPIENS
jgi:hypothetical protein